MDMDKTWIHLGRSDNRYFEGIRQFIDFVKANTSELCHPCPCRKCKLLRVKITVDEIEKHLKDHGMMIDYTTWTSHGEVVDGPSVSRLRDQYIMDWRRQHGESSQFNPTMEILDDMFHCPDVVEDIPIDHSYTVDAYEKYSKLVATAETPLYDGCSITLLDSILESTQLKVDNDWTDKGMNGHLKQLSKSLPKPNVHPESYQEVKKILKDMGLGYDIIHACLYGCVLYYKEFEHLDCCPICEEPRYVLSEESYKEVPQRVVRYFPLIPRLQRLFMSPKIAKEMRWHAERIESDVDLRHPADGETWNEFDREFPAFASEIRNVRLGLATDIFNPFGATSIRYSTWPVVVMPYNLPPSMCMQKEFNILTLLISGPMSPGKCLNVFMRPLIDDLKILWNVGVPTFDRFDGSSFLLRAAVLWTISDFPGLGMLVGMKTKGYKACPLCLDDVEAEYLAGTMSYQGHRRWLDKNHSWRRAANKFNGLIELRDAPKVLSGREVLFEVSRHQYPQLTMKVKSRSGDPNRVCWTHKTIFYELPYWETLKQPYSLDVMHIEKNVFDNIIGTILDLEGKTRDGLKAREGLRIQGVREHLWHPETTRPSSRKREKVTLAPFTILPENRRSVLEMIKEAKYPSGYAGNLRNKINVEDKKFIGLKTHDCHVIMQRLLPVVIRPYLPQQVLQPLISLSFWFQKLCCRELQLDDVLKLKRDIVIILCKLEMIFPPSFFTIMVHLLVHLPDQVLLKGPVHYSWMYPIERQLGAYKKMRKNKRYPEGSIAEQYLIHECIGYYKLYLKNTDEPSIVDRHFDISVYSNLVKPCSLLRRTRLSREEIDKAHWCVLQNCEEVRYFMDVHEEKFYKDFPNGTNEDRIKQFPSYFLYWIDGLD